MLCFLFVPEQNLADCIADSKHREKRLGRRGRLAQAARAAVNRVVERYALDRDAILDVADLIVDLVQAQFHAAAPAFDLSVS